MKTMKLTTGTKVKDHRNPRKTGVVVEDLHPDAPIYGVVRVDWDDNRRVSRHHKFTLQPLQYGWPCLETALQVNKGK
jgi:hypothetical protein